MIRTILILIAYAFCIGCKTYSYFNGPNDMLNKPVLVKMVDGSVLEGKLSVQFETGQSHSEFLKLITADNTEKRIPAKDILCYSFENAWYYPKELNIEAYVIPNRDVLYTPNVNNLLFVKRLTDSSARLQLYELFRSKLTTSDGNDQHEYYLSFSNDHRFTAWSFRGNKIFPDFEYKMSELLADCPALAAKIKQKQDGYFLKQLSLDGRKLQVIRRIVAEYNACF